MTIIKILLSLILLTVGFIGFKFHNTRGPQNEPKVTNLLLTELTREFTPDREIRIDLVEIPPNSTLEKHWHPGEEFHYYLEGDAEIKIEGQPTINGTPGTVGHIPFKKHHVAKAGEKGAKVIVFRVHTKGKPWRYVDED